MAATPQLPIHLVIMAAPDSPELSVLKRLPPTIQIVATGQKQEDFASLTTAQCDDVTALLVCGVGARAAKRDDIQAVFSRLPNLAWMHSSSAGLEHLLFPELIHSNVTLTNAKSVYSHSLAEFTLFACKYFALDAPRLFKAKKSATWDPFDVRELRGSVMGIVGLGDIGKACARLAKAFGMRVVGLRRSPLSADEVREGVVDVIFAPDEICDMAAQCDYLVVATPYTPFTDKIVSRSVIHALSSEAVVVSIGRGKCVDEEALIEALQSNRIRGAAMDVFATEPLPATSPLWNMDNVFLTPHCADRTSNFQFQSMELFLNNVDCYIKEGKLLNVCDKKAGY